MGAGGEVALAEDVPDRQESGGGGEGGGGEEGDQGFVVAGRLGRERWGREQDGGRRAPGELDSIYVDRVETNELAWQHDVWDGFPDMESAIDVDWPWCGSPLLAGRQSNGDEPVRTWLREPRQVQGMGKVKVVIWRQYARDLFASEPHFLAVEPEDTFRDGREDGFTGGRFEIDEGLEVYRGVSGGAVGSIEVPGELEDEGTDCEGDCREEEEGAAGHGDNCSSRTVPPHPNPLPEGEGTDHGRN
jgi:hypothetical protein